MDLHLYNYNNYYNRTIKPVGNTIVIQALTENELYIEWDVNFNPNDGITTEHIIGGINNYQGNADYAILAEEDTPISCWFIIENQRTRGGQYRVLLKRDTVGENLDKVLQAPCFVEKGWVPDTDPAIFNKENMDFNQIKKSEVLLKDSTQVPWLVGYYMKQDSALTANIPATSIDVDYTVNGLSTWSYYNYTQTPARVITEFNLTTFFNSPTGSGAYIKFSGLSKSGNRLEATEAFASTETGIYIYPYTIHGISPETVSKLVDNMKGKANKLFSAADTLFSSEELVDADDLQELAELADKIIFDSSTGTHYRITTDIYIGDTSYTKELMAGETSTFGYEMYDIYSRSNIIGERPTSNSNRSFSLSVARTYSVKLGLDIVSMQSYNVSINPESEAQTPGCPYNIFAMPYGNLRMKFTQELNGESFEVTKAADPDLNMRLCNELIKNYSGGANPVLLDLQLLPYCPIESLRKNIDYDPVLYVEMTDLLATDWAPIKDSNNVLAGAVFYCKTPSQTFNMRHSISIDNIKISNETEFCRLVSPNWNGIFEFSPAKNYGVEYFVVDYELKPYNPYIHISPVWNKSGLYGNRDNDPIGLICGGDFGLTMMSDAWSTYERQNKNYQNIFDRQIQNLEVQQKYQTVGDVVGAVTGTASGAVAGGMTGAMIGGGYGLAAGTVIGGGLSAAGGVADLLMRESMRAETMDYTKDLFGYQMGNIKALPDSLTRVNSFNPNNTIFPILEFYGCTEKEIAALQNKIIYNGMSIGRIGQLKDYINPASYSTYVKGQIILFENLNEDSHFATDIANEIYKGVRI